MDDTIAPTCGNISTNPEVKELGGTLHIICELDFKSAFDTTVPNLHDNKRDS